MTDVSRAPTSDAVFRNVISSLYGQQSFECPTDMHDFAPAGSHTVDGKLVEVMSPAAATMGSFYSQTCAKTSRSRFTRLT